MAQRKMLSVRFLHLGKHSYNRSANAPQPGDRHDLRRILPSAAAGAVNRRVLLQQRSIFQLGVADATLPPLVGLPYPQSDNLFERFRSSLRRDQIWEDHMPSASKSEKVPKEEDEWSSRMTISVADARKLIKASRIEAARARLRTIPSSHISLAKFTEICKEAAGGSDESAREISSALDHSGAVVILTGIVFLRPDQVAFAIESAITSKPMKDLRLAELNGMEARKAEIDGKAEAEVKRELWAGLGFGLLQTAGFMRLTFWELSWDVMEPICFFTTSIYFMLGYYFFLRTSKEPSFEGFFSSRFATKQRRLMEVHSFDLLKFNKLREGLGLDSHVCEASSPQLSSCDCHRHRQRLDRAPFLRATQ